MPQNSAMGEKVGSSTIWKFHDFGIRPHFIPRNVGRLSRLITSFRNLFHVVRGYCEHDLLLRTLCMITTKIFPPKVAVPIGVIALIPAFLANLRTRTLHVVREHGSSKRFSTSSA